MADQAAILKQIEMIEWAMDSTIEIPILKFKVGADPILGVLMGFGDVISGGIGLYVVYLGYQLGMPKDMLSRMVGNLTVDTTVGVVPFIGDAIDFFFKSNRRNLRIVREYLDASNTTLALPPASVPKPQNETQSETHL